MAGATPAEDEYDLNLPEADGQSNQPSQQSAEDSSSGSTPQTAPPAAEPSESDDEQGSATAGGAGGSGGDQGGGRGGDGAGGGGDKAPAESGEQPFASSADDRTVPDLAADRSDGGGISVPLILLAIAAAACAGIAFWRLRRSKGDSDDQSHETGTRPPGDVARGTQSS